VAILSGLSVILSSKNFRDKIIAGSGKNLDLTFEPSPFIMLAGHFGYSCS
jgi:hypothetical protein